MPYRKSIQAGGGEVVLYVRNTVLNNRFLFRVPSDYKQFINTLSRFSRASQSVAVIGFTLTKDGYHLILKERERGEASRFMHRLTVSYTSYLQHRYSLTGKLFKGPYKDSLLSSDDELIQTLTMIHKQILQPSENPETYEWSSYHKYLLGQAPWLHKERVLEYFKGTPLKEALRAFK